MPNELIKVRTITWNGNVYMRLEDVARLVEDFGACEETDVRNRSVDFASKILHAHRLPDNTPAVLRGKT